MLPVRLLRLQGRLGLDCTEMTVLINLLSMWHNTEAPVWKPLGTIAQNMGVSTRTVQRAIAGLEEKKIITQASSVDGKVIRLENVRRVLESAGKVLRSGQAQMEEQAAESAADAPSATE
jgi:CTP-dependent riboflavin kinase